MKDSAQVNESVAKRLGASGVIRLNKQSVQVTVGTQAESVASAMKKVLTKGVASAGSATAAAAPQAAITRESGVVATLVAPVSGEVVALEEVPNEAFASLEVGDGLAIKPTGKTVVAPISGTVVKIFATNHAFCLETGNGVEIVVHMGLDTVALDGKGFTRLVEEGATVAAGQPVLEMDLDYLNAHARSMISPVVVSNSDDFAAIALRASGMVVAGETRLYEVRG
nr:PTS N-acetylglucosamine transporter subunit IIABC [Candidatus Pantoea persica]